MSSTPNLQAEKYRLTTCTHGTPLVSTIKRYTRATGKKFGPKDAGIILFLGHGAGFPKEIWEPTVDDLLNMDDQHAKTTGSQPLIREAWALDCQNHGEACIINGDVLSRNPALLNIYDYADSFGTLYRSGLLGNIDRDLHKLVLVGHSAGAVGVTLATSFFNPPSMIPFSSMILVDPGMSSHAMEEHRTEIYKLVEATTPMRRDIWDSAEAASKWMKSRVPWKTWDPRVFEIYVKYGLQPLPTPYYPDNHSGVTLTTHKTEEFVAFTGTRFSTEAVYRLNQICDYLPVHLVLGARNDLFSREEQDSIVDPKECRNIASVTRVKGAGHLIVQEAPRRLAETLFGILRGNSSSRGSKL
ncbi:hypothetical protein L208DRAFT_144014 [Tricholoma matsutake]|nr:hypothetical protein L208DRAFT_144014 [Tricholoma matsutake 945]